MAKKLAQAQIKDLPIILDLGDADTRQAIAQALAQAGGGVTVGKPGSSYFERVVLPAGTKQAAFARFAIKGIEGEPELTCKWTHCHCDSTECSISDCCKTC